jgi:hypothetical protein
MATSGSYYLNGPSLTSSTSVFTDSGLTTLAPDGFYSDGVIVREQVGGVLLPAVACSSCEPQCLEYSAISEGPSGVVEYNDCEGNPALIYLSEFEEVFFCALSNSIVPSEGIAIIEVGACTPLECTRYLADAEAESGGVTYTDCFGDIQTITLAMGETQEFCASDTPSTSGGVLISLVAGTCP